MYANLPCFHIKSTLIVIVLLDRLVFSSHSSILTNQTDVYFLKHELTYPWIMGCLLVVLLPSLFWDHFITSMTLLLSKKKRKSVVWYSFNSLFYRLKVNYFYCHMLEVVLSCPSTHNELVCFDWLSNEPPCNTSKKYRLKSQQSQ